MNQSDEKLTVKVRTTYHCIYASLMQKTRQHQNIDVEAGNLYRFGKCNSMSSRAEH